MMKVDVIYDTGGDWAALYFNGKLKYQGHSIRDEDWRALFEELGAVVNAYQESDITDLGSFPDNLEEVNITYG